MTTIRGAKILICLLCVYALQTGIRAAVLDDSSAVENPYSAIWVRNAFDLKSPAGDDADATITNQAPPNVQLTGITTILGDKRALFLVQDSSSATAKQKSFILTEGERQDGLDVLEINTKKATAKIRLNGIVSTVALETNKPSPAPIVPIQNVANAAAPRGRVITQTRTLESAFAQPSFGSARAIATSGTYAKGSQQFIAGGFQSGNSQPSPVTNPGATQGAPDSSSTFANPNSSSTPGLSPQAAAALATLQEAAREGQFAAPAPLGQSSSGVAGQGATIQNGRYTPPPPNFAAPPPLPADLQSVFQSNGGK